MIDTKSLILSLVSDAKPVKYLRPPIYSALFLFVILLIYGIITQSFSGIRADIVLQLHRPFFVVEILSLILLIFTSAIAAILTMYPDAYQKPKLLLLPYWSFGLLILIIIYQIFIQNKTGIILPPKEETGWQCCLSIALISLIPSALIFVILHKGASVRQFQSGAFSVLAASGVGCLTLRIAEATDSLIHLATWHYLPTIIFAMLGAFIGRIILKW
ncbi:MAG: NrsF family protein [Pseudomonadota bacterium]